MPGKEEKAVEVLDHGTFLEARYLGAYALARYKRQMEESVKACLERDLDLLLVDITGLAGYAPSTYERHQIGTLGAALSRELKKVAVVATTAQMGPDVFATMVARNRGLSIQPFQDREEAVRWLLARPKRPKA